MDNSNKINKSNKSNKYVPPHMRNKNNYYQNNSQRRQQVQQTQQAQHTQHTQQQHLPGYKLQESEKPIVPINMESHKAGCEKANPYKMNFLDAIRKNKKEFTVTKQDNSNTRTHHYDYICANCSKMIKREGLNNNNTNYCWECHSDIVFKDSPIVINDEEDDEFMGVPLRKRYEIRYENYLAGKYDHYFDDYVNND